MDIQSELWLNKLWQRAVYVVMKERKLTPAIALPVRLSPNAINAPCTIGRVHLNHSCLVTVR